MIQQVNSNLSNNPENYLKDILHILVNKFGEDLISIILFGSFAEGYYSKGVSDVDVIVVLSNSCQKEDLESARATISSIEKRYNFLQTGSGFADRILSLSSEHTGMFLSYFVCREIDILRGDFSRIFFRNRFLFLLSDAIVPKNIILTNIFKRYKVIYGRNLVLEAKINDIVFTDIIKCFIINFTLSLAAIILYPFSDKATKYSMEAMKWSLINCRTYIKKKSTNLNESAEYFRKNRIIRAYINELMDLRKCYRNNKYFAIKLPFRIICIHSVTLLASIDIIKLRGLFKK